MGGGSAGLSEEEMNGFDDEVGEEGEEEEEDDDDDEIVLFILRGVEIVFLKGETFPSFNPSCVAEREKRTDPLVFGAIGDDCSAGDCVLRVNEAAGEEDGDEEEDRNEEDGKGDGTFEVAALIRAGVRMKGVFPNRMALCVSEGREGADGGGGRGGMEGEGDGSESDWIGKMFWEREGPFGVARAKGREGGVSEGEEEGTVEEEEDEDEDDGGVCGCIDDVNKEGGECCDCFVGEMWLSESDAAFLRVDAENFEGRDERRVEEGREEGGDESK